MKILGRGKDRLNIMEMRAIGKLLAHRTGAMRAYHFRRNTETLTVLMFHRVLPEDELARVGADPLYTVTPGFCPIAWRSYAGTFAGAGNTTKSDRLLGDCEELLLGGGDPGAVGRDGLARGGDRGPALLEHRVERCGGGAAGHGARRDRLARVLTRELAGGDRLGRRACRRTGSRGRCRG